MKTVIIDDEERGRKIIKNLINRYALNLDVVGEANSVETGIELIESSIPELVFLDVELGDGTGFELLSRLSFTDFKIIFCTSHERYAIKAFRFSAIDYLLKPVEPEVFRSAVRRVVEQPVNKELCNILEQNSKKISRIALRSLEKITIVNLSDIVRCESTGNYTLFVLADGTRTIVSKTLKDYEKLLEPYGFLRIHKSYIINLDSIVRYIKGDGGFVELTDGTKIDVSRRKKEVLLEVIDKRVL